MLTNVEIILLRFIKSSPSYAYEIERKIEKRNIRNWVKIGGASVYQVLDRLCKKNLLEYKLEKEGNMPERKRYYITPEGDKEFMESAKEKLSHFEYYYLDLSVGLACRHYLEDGEFKEIIKERLAELTEFIDNFNESFEKSKELYPTKRFLIREYVLDHYKLEKNFLETLLKEN